MHDTAVKKQADEKRRAERKLRHQQDDLRYALKKLPEPVDLNMTYEAVCFFIAPAFVRRILTWFCRRLFP